MVRKEIEQRLSNHILECIGWAERNLKISLLILYVTLDFSKRRTVSFVKPKFLEYHMMFSLSDIEDLRVQGGSREFYEEHKTTNSFGDIGTFVGNWEEHLAALTYHEMAHVFDSMARYEPYSNSHIAEYYGYKIRRGRIKHHNLLWRKIYRDFKIKEKPKVQNTILIPNDSGFHCYYKSGDKSCH